MSTTLTKQVRNFTDLDFSFEMHPSSHNVFTKSNINAIKQSVKNLLLLKRGDKPFHPEIHSPIYEFMFENFSAVTQVVLEGEIYKYLSVYEPRVFLQSVSINFPNEYSIYCKIVGVIVNIEEPFTVNILIDRLR